MLGINWKFDARAVDIISRILEASTGMSVPIELE